MKITTTKHQLTMALFSPLCNSGATFNDNCVFKTILAIEKEDGSGHSFNVTGYNYHGQRITVHVITTD